MIENKKEIKARIINEDHNANILPATATSTDNSVFDLEKLLDKQDKWRAQYHGKEVIGFAQKTIPELDSKLLGLRDLMLLAAGPNAGKTALTIQLAIDTLRNNDDICLVYISLEMPIKTILLRMRSYLARMPWRTLVLGRKISQNTRYTEEDIAKLTESKQQLINLKDRMIILDEENHPNITLKTLEDFAENLKRESLCNHVMFVIDYLQVWPTPERLSSKSELELDKWRINEMKKLRDKFGGDPVLVISEARKPSNSGGREKKNWGSDMSDVMGSARTAYRSDIIFLFEQLSNDELLEGWNNSIKNEGRIEKTDKAKIREIFEKDGYSIIRFIIDKGRDGTHKGSFLLRFHFYENRFSPFSWEEEVKNQNNHLPVNNKKRKDSKDETTNFLTKCIDESLNE